MSYVQALVPAEHASNHLLVLPGTPGPQSLVELADAWFADVRWLREPRVVEAVRRATGARFRGIAVSEPPRTEPGVLGIGAEHGAAGPFEVAPEASPQAGLTGPSTAFALGRVDGTFDARTGRPTSLDDRDGIARAFAAGLPEGEELRLVQWGVAVARKLGGVVLADGRHLLRPDPAGAVDLTVYAGRQLSAEDLLALLRAQVATAQADTSPSASGPGRVRMLGRTPYDGTVVVEAEQVDRVPRVLSGLEPRSYGPHVVRITWVPQDPYELRTEVPSGVHAIARARMRAVVARLALHVCATAGGTVVDDGAFVATTAQIEQRTSEQTPGTVRAWV
ncbi:hypothetical protein ACNHYB_09840 [Isoptericola jiangsuensis]|uniref:hypothetical protein n=1 Tax=Isoptericola jiangsuensis TaxID=548579 RepID=UPI003AABAE5B